MADARQPGTSIDGFVLEERIHRGSMAEIWNVAGPDGGTPLVMKIPAFREGDDPAALVGFEVEQMILPTLSGPHVPRFVAAGDWSVHPYLVMERIAGPSLRTRLDQTPLSPAETASLGARIADAVHDIHGQHVIHLDIKPSNVLFREDGTAVLIDFGLSRHDRLPDLLAEQFRLPMGTAPYISPEQIAPGPPRPPQRPVRARRRPVLPHHRGAALRQPGERARAPSEVVSRPRPAARPEPGVPAMAPGGRPEVPRSLPHRPLRDRRPPRFPPPAPRRGTPDGPGGAENP